jgi:hypothetical protein
MECQFMRSPWRGARCLSAGGFFAFQNLPDVAFHVKDTDYAHNTFSHEIVETNLLKFSHVPRAEVLEV